MGKKSINSEIKQCIVGLHLGGFNSSEIARILSLYLVHVYSEQFKNLKKLALLQTKTDLDDQE